MSNYTKTTNFAAKDSLPSGNANKIVKGTEIDTEFDNIATASATKADIAGPTFTGTVTIPTVDLNGGAIDGTTVGASTAAAITGTTIVANTSINIAGDGATVTGIKDEDDMSSNSATKLATQQSIKAYVDSQVTAQDLDFQADSGGALSIDLDSETLTFTGGTGVDTSGSGNAVTFAIDSTVATLTGTQTLTNKTLTSPTLNTPTIGTSFTIGSATITEAELEILDGATVTTAELNVLDGITSTTAELNILDGVTSTAAELNILDGVTSTAAELNILDGVTSTAAELNILDGVTATTAELNIMDGVTATTAELNYVDGVTSAIQTQLDAKAPTANPTFTGSFTSPGIDDNATSTAMTLDSSGNVGIGTSSPSGALHVSRSGLEAGITLERTTSATAKFTMAANDGNLVFTDQNQSAERMRIDSSGRVGIGTSSPQAKLDVSGVGNFSTAYGTFTGDGLHIQSNGTGGAGAFTGGISFSRISADNNSRAAGIAGVQGADADQVGLAFFTHPSAVTTDSLQEAMRIDSSGNVGIGTSSPSDLLTLGTNSAGGNLSLNSSSYASNGLARFFGTDGNEKLQIGSLSATSAYLYTPASTDLAFFAGAAERMRIDSSGNVGIGDSTFAAGKLQVYDSAGNHVWLKGRASDGTSSVSFRNNADDTYNGRIQVADTGGMLFQVAGSTRATIDSSGNLLVGDTSSSFPTNVRAFKVFEASIAIGHNTSNTSGDSYVRFGYSTNTIGSITQNGTTAVLYNTSSDQRLKENIADADDAGSKVDAIQVRKFDWIADGSHQDYGMVAQELVTVAPEAVSAPEDPEEMMGVDYSKLVPMLVKEIQSLRARVQQLENN